MIDLHCHSTASDGTLAPAELLRAAAGLGLRALALTDHDTTDGLEEFLGAGRVQGDGILAVPGIELACLDEAGGDFHIVGLFIAPGDRGLQELLGRIQRWRLERNERMLARLQGLGLEITWEEVRRECPGDIVGRPHFAAALIGKGYCRDLQQAFDRYLGRGRPGYVPRSNPRPEEAISAIHGAGGLAIWAHPYSRGRLTNARFRDIAERLQAGGLDGLEAYYTLHSPAQTRSVLRTAAETGLLVSGGSDFHGSRMPDVLLGRGRGALAVPDRLLAPMLERLPRTHLLHMDTGGQAGKGSRR